MTAKGMTVPNNKMQVGAKWFMKVSSNVIVLMFSIPEKKHQQRMWIN
jgi:hypothetical protein